MPNWLWPHSRREETSVPIRMGRVAHWFFLAGSVWILGSGLVLSRGESDKAAVIGFFLFGAFFSALFGRAIRYILADE